jgi:hypothetical protein
MQGALETAKDRGHNSTGPRCAGPSPCASANLHPILALQQQAGNQAVQSLLRSGLIQAKLAIGNPRDPDEREADQVADRIMRMHAGAPSSSPCSCAEGKEMCAECRRPSLTPGNADETVHRTMQRPAASLGRRSSCSDAGSAEFRTKTDSSGFRPGSASSASASLFHLATQAGECSPYKVSGGVRYPSVGGCTECEFPGGPKLHVYTNGCEKPCIERHEKIHFDDIADCCNQTLDSWIILSPEERTRRQDQWSKWVAAVRDSSECRALTAEDECLDALIRDKKCDNPSAGLSPEDQECCRWIKYLRDSDHVLTKQELCPPKPLPPCPFRRIQGP